MEKMLICYILAGLELLGDEKFKIGGLQLLQEIDEVKIKPEDDKIKKGCELLNLGLSMVIADNDIAVEKKITIAKIVADAVLSRDKYPAQCADIEKKCLVIILKSVEPEIKKRAKEAWDNFFEIAACAATATISPEVTEIEKVMYLFKKFPEIPKAGLSYLRYCYRSGKLPPEEEWLPDMLEFADVYEGNIDLTTEVLSCIS